MNDDPEHSGARPSSATEPLTIELASSVSSIDPEGWDRCAGGDNPFVSHAFLCILEESGSVGPDTGWAPAPLALSDANGELLGALPSYLKMHSQGEYVFDHSWADAWERAGGSYYPKLQIASPFSPVPGPRILVGEDRFGPALLRGAEALVDGNGLSSAHATFVSEDQVALFRKQGWLIREDSQFHWLNRDYEDFDDFLAALASRKRKAIRKERARAQELVTIKRLSGSEIRSEHWDAFWIFYQDTGARKWGQPYLTREFFTLLGERLGDRVVLVLAELDGSPVAGALNLLGGDALFGRYWGAIVDIDSLHFELCYYQAIEIAIERGLGRVEAGAQGSHKLARGYEPVPTYSAHYIPDEGFRAAVADFLERERQAVKEDRAMLAEMAPFKKQS